MAYSLLSTVNIVPRPGGLVSAATAHLAWTLYIDEHFIGNFETYKDAETEAKKLTGLTV